MRRVADGRNRDELGRMKPSLLDTIAAVEAKDAGECVRDNDELLDRWAGGYLPNRELREFFWHLDCCQQCREFVRDLVEKNLLSVPR